MPNPRHPEHPLLSDPEEAGQRDPIEGLVGEILSNLGELNHLDGLRDTPKRVAKLFRE